VFIEVAVFLQYFSGAGEMLIVKERVA